MSKYILLLLIWEKENINILHIDFMLLQLGQNTRCIIPVYYYSVFLKYDIPEINFGNLKIVFNTADWHVFYGLNWFRWNMLNLPR